MKKRKKSSSIPKKQLNRQKIQKQKKILDKVINKRSKKKIVFTQKRNTKEFTFKKKDDQNLKSLVYKTYDNRFNKQSIYDKRRNTEKKKQLSKENQFKLLLNQNHGQQQQIKKLNQVLKQQKLDQKILEDRLKSAKKQIQQLQVHGAKNLLQIQSDEKSQKLNESDQKVPTQNYYIPIPMQEEKNYDSQNYDSEFTEETVHECQNMSLIILQCVDAFLRENENQSDNSLSKVLEKVVQNIQENNDEQNDMELFMFVLKELDIFLKAKAKEQNQLKKIIKELLSKQLQYKQKQLGKQQKRPSGLKNKQLASYFEECITLVKRQLQIDQQEQEEEFLKQSLDSEKLRIINMFLTDPRVLNFIKINLFLKGNKTRNKSTLPSTKKESRDISSSKQRNKKIFTKPNKKRPNSVRYSQLFDSEDKNSRKKRSPYKTKNKLVNWTQKVKKPKKYIRNRRSKSSALKTCPSECGRRSGSRKEKKKKRHKTNFAPLDYIKKMQQEQPWIFKTYDKPPIKFGLRKNKDFIHGSLKTEPSQKWRRLGQEYFHGSLKTEPSQKWTARFKKKSQQYNRPNKKSKYLMVSQSLDLSLPSQERKRKQPAFSANRVRVSAPFKKQKKGKRFY